MAAASGAGPPPQMLPPVPDYLSSSSTSPPISPSPLSSGPLSLPSSAPGIDTDPLSFSTARDMKYHLQHLLDSKEKQLQQAGSLGQRVLAQQMELEERIRQLQELEADKPEDDQIDHEARERYRELADTIVAWDQENALLSSAFGASSKRFLNGGTSHSPAIPYTDLPREQEHERTKPSGTSAAQSRRAKNAAHRADDVEFAFEIGSGLLTEVRRLQSLLGERDKAIQDMKEEKDDLEKSVESLRTALRQQEQSADKFKEENWNLEVTLQDLRTQLSDSQSSVQRLESEHKRLTKALATARDAGDQHKNEAERLQSQLEDLKAKHETDVAQARKHAAGLARDKSDLQQSVDTLKAEMARASRRLLPRFGSPLTPGLLGETKDFLTPAGAHDEGADGDVFGTGRPSTNRRNLDVSGLFPPDDFGGEDGFGDSPDDASPLRKPFLAANHPTNEIEALQQRLAHAQRQISTLKGSLNREKQLRMRLEGGGVGRRGSALLDGGDGEGDEEDGEDGEGESGSYNEENTAVERRVAKRSTTPFKVGGGKSGRGRGRGRGRGGITLIQRLGMAAHSPASEFNGDQEEEEELRRADEGVDGSPPPPVPPIPIRFNQAEEDNEEEDEASQFFGSNHGHGHGDKPKRDSAQPQLQMQNHTHARSRSRSPSPPPSPLQPTSNRTSIASVEGMDPAFANVLKRVPSTGSTGSTSASASASASAYASSPLRHAVLGRRARGGTRGGVPFQQARPPSIVDPPEALSSELGDLSAEGLVGGVGGVGGVGVGGVGGISPMRSFRASLLNEVEISEEVIGGGGEGEAEGVEEEDVEEEEEGVEYVRVRKVQKVEFGCQTEPEPAPVLEVPSVEDKEEEEDKDQTVQLNEQSALVHVPPVLESKPEPERVEMGVQSQPEPEPAPEPAPAPAPEPEPVLPAPAPAPQVVTSEVALQTEPEPEPVVVVVEKAEMGVQHDEPVPIPEKPAPVFVDSGMGTDPLPEPEPEPVIKTGPTASHLLVGKGLPPLVISENAGRRSTLTQSDFSRSRKTSSTSVGDSTITRTFLAQRHGGGGEEDEDEIDEGEETETGAETETEDDYVDARQSIAMTTPSEDFHSIRTITDNDYSDEEEEEEEGSDAESIKASHFSASVHARSMSSLGGGGDDVRPPTSASVYYDPEGYVTESEREPEHEPEPESPGLAYEEEEEEEEDPEAEAEAEAEEPVQKVSYETVGVSADLYEPPSPVVIERVRSPPPPPPKPEVKEISIQTDEWKPPAPVPAVPVPVQLSTPTPVHAPVFIPPSPSPASKGLYRVGSSGGQQQQFQFIPPPPPVSAHASAASAHSNGQQLPPPHSAPVMGGPVFSAPSPISSVFRESTLGRRATTKSDRRQSIESLISSSGTGVDDQVPRSRVPSSSGNALLASVDKSRPPVMSLPPPPKLPPPPGSMPPPNFIPERKILASLNGDGPPPRPSSPPPPELIQRATTPLGSILSVPGKYGSQRSHHSSIGPSSQNLRQPSTSSFRSAGALSGGGNTLASVPPSQHLHSYSVRERERRERSSTSLTSDHSMASPRSSISSEHHAYHSLNQSTRSDSGPPTTPNKTADITPRANNLGGAGAGGASTDPAIIHAITQTMIGEFLWKYTRKAIGKGVGEKRHERFFWVHPYTKTLYWSSSDPGSSNVSESSAKSAYIEGVRSVLDPNPMPPGLYQYSVVVSTPQREMKITCPTKDRHDIWMSALKYLLTRPTAPMVTSPANNTVLPETPERNDYDHRPPLLSPQSQRSTRGAVAGEPWNTTPRGQRSRSQLSVHGSVGKRSGTPAHEYLRWNAPDSPFTPDKSFVDVHPHDPDELDFELHDDMMSDEGYEGLENVRACCDGKHTVGHSGKHHHHHHHHNHQQQQQPQQQQQQSHQQNQGTLTSRKSVDNQHLDVNPHLQEQARPSSPAWSFRSRTGSTQSHEGGGGGLFSWGRGEDGKLRFGSRRSTKTSVPVQD